MNWNSRIRQFHRWMSITFTVGVVANIVCVVASVREEIAIGVGLATLVPLFLLLFTGLYMFALPYMAKSPDRQQAGAMD